jgi:hypothetical protein
MKAKKLMNDSFYSNNQSFSGVDSVDSLTSDYFYHFTDTSGNLKKLSGWTGRDPLNPSGIIIENSYTTAITVSPTGRTAASGSTFQITVTDQNAVNVTTECTFSGTTASVTVVNYVGLVTLVGPAGSSSVIVRHPDVVAAVTVPITITT